MRKNLHHKKRFINNNEASEVSTMAGDLEGAGACLINGPG